MTRSPVFAIQSLPSVHLAGGRPTLRLLRRGLHSRTRLLHHDNNNIEKECSDPNPIHRVKLSIEALACSEDTKPELNMCVEVENNATNNDNTSINNTITQLDEEILNLLSDAPKDHDLLINGLNKDFKDKIIEEYPIPGNCQLFKAPILNPEVRATVSDLLQKKNSSLTARQGPIGIALTSLTCAMDIIITDKSETSQTLLEHICNASRLLCDSHNIDTKMRRNFLVSSLNNKLKDTLKESKRDKFLFGELLPEKLKASKATTKTSQDLRSYKPKPTVAPSSSTTHLNWKHPQSNHLNALRKTPASSHHRTAEVAAYQRGETARRTRPMLITGSIRDLRTPGD